MQNNTGIGTLQERSLHASIKELYKDTNSQEEVSIDGYVVDIVKNGVLIEVQTRNISAIKEKLLRLMKNHEVRLVYPIPIEKWVIRQNFDSNKQISRRRSPKRLKLENIFDELVSIPTFILHSNFSLEVLLIKEEEIRVNDGSGSWRRKGWRSIDRRLLDVIDRRIFAEPDDFLHLIPDTIKQPFTTATLAEEIEISKHLAQKMAYCMRKMNVLKYIGKKGNAYLYSTDDNNQCR